MAWTNIIDALIQVGKPLRALDIRSIRDNIVALANGDAGAPRIQNPAYQDYSITFEKHAAPSVGEAVLKWLVGPTGLRASSSDVLLNQYEPWNEVTGVRTVAFHCRNYGAVRIRAQFRTGLGGLNRYCYMRIVRDGTVVAEWATNSSNFVEQVADVAISPGSLITVQFRPQANDGGVIACIMANVRVCTGTWTTGGII